MLEYVDHLHEHFVDPVHVEGGRYRAPRAAGFGARMHDASLATHRYPDGPVWSRPAGA
jgi:L-fuconate dehydratase